MENERDVGTFFLDQPESHPVEEKKPLIDFPTDEREFKAFLDSANQDRSKANDSESTKSCFTSIWVPPGVTYDVGDNCEAKIRPMSVEEQNKDKENLEYYKSPEYQKDLRSYFRLLKAQGAKVE